MRGSRSHARIVRYCIGCHAHNNCAREVQSHRAPVKKTFITSKYQAHNIRDMARMLCDFLSTTRPHIEGTKIQRHGHMYARVAVRTVSSDLSSVSSHFVHCYPPLYTNYGLFQDFKDATDQVNPNVRLTIEQKIDSRDTVSQAQATYQDPHNLGFCISSVLYSSRSDDDGG